MMGQGEYPMNFTIQRAEPADYKIFYNIIQDVWARMEHQEWFAADDEDYLFKTLQPGHGLGYKAVDQDTGAVAGVFLAALPGLDESNLGYDIGLPKEALLKAAHMDSVAILPGCRGHRLQYRLMQQAESDLKAMGIRFLLCTVHPDNRYSRDNVIKQGYEFVLQKRKYNGSIRDIFLKRL